MVGGGGGEEGRVKEGRVGGWRGGEGGGVRGGGGGCGSGGVVEGWGGPRQWDFLQGPGNGISCRRGNSQHVCIK